MLGPNTREIEQVSSLSNGTAIKNTFDHMTIITKSVIGKGRGHGPLKLEIAHLSYMTLLCMLINVPLKS